MYYTVVVTHYYRVIYLTIINNKEHFASELVLALEVTILLVSFATNQIINALICSMF